MTAGRKGKKKKQKQGKLAENSSADWDKSKNISGETHKLKGEQAKVTNGEELAGKQAEQT